MGRSCCVPGCHSNYNNTPSTSAFKFPKDKTLREKWIKNIKREKFEEVLSKNSVVCIKHFEPRFILWEDIFPIKDGDPICISRKFPKLTNDAYPTIFRNHPSYQFIKDPKSRKKRAQEQLQREEEDRFGNHSVKATKSRRKRAQQQFQREDEQFQEWCEQDRIRNFESFTDEVKKRNVSPLSRNDHVPLLQADEDIPSISIGLLDSSDEQVYEGSTPSEMQDEDDFLSDIKKGVRHEISSDIQEEYDIMADEDKFESARTRDEFVVYGEHVANQLRSLQDKYAIAVAQFNIDQILFKAKMGEFSKPV